MRAIAGNRATAGPDVAQDADVLPSARERLLERQQVAQLLLDEVADHPLGLRAEDVEGVRLRLPVRRRLQREQADLRTVAVADDQLVLKRDRRERLAGQPDFEPLALHRHGLAAALQGIASEGHHDTHARQTTGEGAAAG